MADNGQNGTAPEPLLDQKKQRYAERVFYATGLMLDATDFTDEQTYHRGRLARALAYLHGSGTVAGLEVQYVKAGPDAKESEIRVSPGLAIDKLGRLIEVPSAACIRIVPWFKATGAPLKDAFQPGPPAFIEADVFLRFRACDQGKTPAFASGPFDATDASVPSRLRDWYQLDLLPRKPGDLLPEKNWAVLPDGPETRQEKIEKILLSKWREGTSWTTDGLPAPDPEHLPNQDPTSLLLARVQLPAKRASATAVPESDGDPADPDQAVRNLVRRFVYPSGALALLL